MHLKETKLMSQKGDNDSLTSPSHILISTQYNNYWHQNQ